MSTPRILVAVLLLLAAARCVVVVEAPPADAGPDAPTATLCPNAGGCAGDG